MTEVIQLKAGSAPHPLDHQTRPDWSSQAQPPGRDGVIAHTPDPASYHRSPDGRIVLPRSTQFGASRGFDHERPGRLNIDPSDHVHGTGGITVDVGDLRCDPQALAAAVAAAEGDPTRAWALAAGYSDAAIIPAVPGEEQKPSPIPGYVVPPSTVDGAQLRPGAVKAVITAPGTTAAGTTTVPVPLEPLTNPAVRSKEAAMKLPQKVNVPRLQPPPVAPASTAEPPVQGALERPQMPLRSEAIAGGPHVDSTQAALLRTLEDLTKVVGGLQIQQPLPDNGPPLVPQIQAPQEGTIPASVPRRESTEELLDYRLPFLTPVPSMPQERVVFDLGAGGTHLKYFHHVEITGHVISLVYDDRYRGDRFHPPYTKQGSPIRVSFPDRENVSYVIHVPQLSLSIGCLDILNLVVVPSEAAKQEKTGEDSDDELPVSWPSTEEALLEQTIRAGRQDLGE